MLLMEHPCRLSTDIDIIAEPGTDLDKYLDRASEIFPFIDRVAGLTQRLLYTADCFPFETWPAFVVVSHWSDSSNAIQINFNFMWTEKRS